MIFSRRSRIFATGLAFLFTLFFVMSQVAEAHPLDVTGTELIIDSSKNSIEVSSFIHPFLINILLENNDVFTTHANTIYKHPKLLTDYFQLNFEITNNGEKCSFESFNLPPLDEFEIFGGGVELETTMQCNDIEKLVFVNKMFIEYSELQTNQMFFYSSKNLQKIIYKKILTAKIHTSDYDIKRSSSDKKEIDTDEDGLTDAEEEIYGTDKNRKDTDNDGYTDKEEVDNGWNVLSSEPSPGQASRSDEFQGVNNGVEQTPQELNNLSSSTAIKTDKVETKKQGEEFEVGMGDDVAEKTNLNSGVELISGDVSSKNIIDNEIEITTTTSAKENREGGAKFFKTGKLSTLLSKINNLFDKKDLLSIFTIFFFVFILGMLHAFESGHGKSILISYLLDNDKKFNDAIKYSGFLTITHLADVIVLVVLFKFFSLVSDSQKFVLLVQKIGAYLLLVIAIYYLIHHIFLSKRKKSSIKSAGLLGVIAGLAPCTIGWALMIAIISIGKINWLIPIIIVFGIGIFASLLFFSYVILKLKEKIISKSKNLSRYAGIASSLLLLIIAIVGIWNW